MPAATCRHSRRQEARPRPARRSALGPQIRGRARLRQVPAERGRRASPHDRGTTRRRSADQRAAGVGAYRHRRALRRRTIRPAVDGTSRIRCRDCRTDKPGLSGCTTGLRKSHMWESTYSPAPMQSAKRPTSFSARLSRTRLGVTAAGVMALAAVGLFVPQDRVAPTGGPAANSSKT